MLRNFKSFIIRQQRLSKLEKSRSYTTTTHLNLPSQKQQENSEATTKTPNDVPKSNQINIYEQKSGLIEGSKIEYYMKKKEIGMTDDETTLKGKAKAKAKDFTALIFVGTAGVALSYALYTLYKQYFAKKPADYAFEIAQQYVKNNTEIEDQLGVDYKIDTRDSKGHRRWGEDQVISSTVQKIEEFGGLEAIKINFFLTTSNRKCLVHALMVKAEGESPSQWFPMQVFGELDYDQKFMKSQILFIDYSKEIKSGVSLEILRNTLADEQDNISYAKDSLLNKSETKASKNSVSSPLASEKSNDDDNSGRLRPKW